MANKTKEQLEKELEEALAKIQQLEADNVTYSQQNEQLHQQLAHAREQASKSSDPDASAASGKAQDAPDLNEADIRVKIRAGLDRKQAIAVLRAQAAEDFLRASQEEVQA